MSLRPISRRSVFNAVFVRLRADLSHCLDRFPPLCRRYGQTRPDAVLTGEERPELGEMSLVQRMRMSLPSAIATGYTRRVI